jgi:short-subunit dehydrogenase
LHSFPSSPSRVKLRLALGDEPKENIMTDDTKRTALVTGASMGIGAAFARALAERGANLVLAARSRDKLEALATALSGAYGVRAHAVAVDLSKPGAAERLRAETESRGLAIDLLVNNAGFATYGRFDEISAERQREEILLNCAALVDMAHAFLPAMVRRGSGAIVNVASTAAFQPLPYMAVYGATKAFVLSFSEALWAENRARGVRVLALCPGATDTPFFDVVGAPEASVGAREKPELVVARALDALDRGRSHLVSGTRNYVMAQAARVLPRAMLAASVERVMRPRGSRPALAGAPKEGRHSAGDGRTLIRTLR